MSKDDRTQALTEIDFCRTRLRFIWVKYKKGPKQLRPAYSNMLDAGFLLFDAAVTRLLAIEGIEPLPRAEDDEGRGDY